MMAQSFISMNEVLRSDTLISYTIIDSVQIKQILKSRHYQVLVNDRLIDSTGLRIQNLPIVFDNSIFFNADIKEKDEYKKLLYNLSTQKVEKYDLTFDYDNGLNQIYIYEPLTAKIFIYNPITGEKDIIVNFWDIVKKTVYGIDKEEHADEIFDRIFFISKQTAFIELCYNDGSSGDGCTERRYFLVYGTTQKIDITKNLRPMDRIMANEKLESYISSVDMISTDGEYIKESCLFWVDAKPSRQERISRLFDKKFNYISDLLYLEYSTNGINIQNGIVQNYFLNSITDAKDSTNRYIGGYANKRVIVPYKFNPFFELAMYKAYNSNLLTNEDIKGLEKYELGILRNLIFAKYNYAFSSEFYQAYFNLYEFYGNDEAQKSRVKDVNNMLTETDKANIKLIKEMENNL